MTKKIIVMSVLLFSSMLVYNCKKKNTTSTNADYAGAWSVSDHCNSSFSYQVTITATGSNGLTITNFHGPTGFTITATVSDKTITIPSQQVMGAGGVGPYTFSGSGTFTPPSSLSISYVMAMGGVPLNCTATCTK